MRCLWLTLADPEPRHNGQYVYSGGLIDSVAATGSEIEVLGLRRPDSPPRQNGNGSGCDEHIVWSLPGEPLDPLQSRWGSLASTAAAHRLSLPHRRRCARACRTCSSSGGWDGIVFDGISVGWALAPVQAFYDGKSDRPRLIYVSHNHEESLRQQVADSQRAFFRRQAVRLDAAKVSRLERDLVDQVDFSLVPEIGRRLVVRFGQALAGDRKRRGGLRNGRSATSAVRSSSLAFSVTTKISLQLVQRTFLPSN